MCSFFLSNENMILIRYIGMKNRMDARKILIDSFDHVIKVLLVI